MSPIHLTHTDATHATNLPFDLQRWLKKAKGIALLNEQGLSSIIVITGYILAIASLTLASISGGFPWFLLMLIVLSPLYALMVGDQHPS